MVDRRGSGARVGDAGPAAQAVVGKGCDQAGLGAALHHAAVDANGPRIDVRIGKVYTLDDGLCGPVACWTTGGKVSAWPGWRVRASRHRAS